jgi:hypothetical protein
MEISLEGFALKLWPCPIQYCTPLWIAAANGSLDIIEYLLSWDANANCELYAAIFVAAYQKHGRRGELLCWM